VVNLIDPTSAAFLHVESRTQPMHVGGLHLFEKPEGAGRNYATEMFESLSQDDAIAPLFLKRPQRSLLAGGQLTWVPDEHFDIEHHVRHSALPKPGRVRELLTLCSRLHSTPLGRERPLWEAHVIEGLRDGRIALYTKTHHALVDGISSMRLLQSVLSRDPDQRDMPAPWSFIPSGARPSHRGTNPFSVLSPDTFRTALGLSAEAAGLPGALLSTLNRSMRNETSALSLHAPRTMFNRKITGSRRFAAQDWPIERLKAVGKATGTTLNDVVMAMCSGALRTYLLEQDALPDDTLISMVPVGLNARQAQVASADGGNAVGAVMVRLGTDLADPADRLQAVHDSMRVGKEALSQMTPLQIVAMSALGMAPSIFPMLGLPGPVPFNVIISNVPGPRKPLYLNGAKLVGTYPLSIPINGMALNITCTSYDDKICFGIIGCMRTVPHLQRMLGHLDDELKALERAAGL
jgi:diacylglycerol O-acyltransferase